MESKLENEDISQDNYIINGKLLGGIINYLLDKPARESMKFLLGLDDLEVFNIKIENKTPTNKKIKKNESISN
jgi:hypothetical protein